MAKYIFVTGGVVSGLGKGITAASLGRLLKQQGLKVGIQKLDPYMNIDPGTMSPYQHGEVFVTDDGEETDLDLGHYERFIDENLTRYANLTSGKVFWRVLNKERVGAYLGDTVQIIPQVTNEIKDFIYQGSEKTGMDVMIIEIGGTIGDIEGQSFLEAIRQVALEVGKQNCLFLHVTLVPYIHGSGEHKSKPTQHSVKELRAAGISPDLIIARADEPIGTSIKSKISLFCNVKLDCVIENLTVPILYEAPLMLHQQGLDAVVCRELNLPYTKPDLSSWQEMTEAIRSRTEIVKIALVGKYTKFPDAYLSVIEALNHSGYPLGAKIQIVWVNSESLHEDKNLGELHNVHGIIVPGGFGDRGIEGMILATQFARENNIPFLGICLGMQIAAIEFARNRCGLSDADSREFKPDAEHKVIDIMESQISIEKKGGTMRLGAYPCVIHPKTRMAQAYGMEIISERHRHRFEFNNRYRKIMEDEGLVISGLSPDGLLVEAIELPANDFFVGVQFHPEFQSRPNRPHPLFREFVGQAKLKASELQEQLV